LIGLCAALVLPSSAQAKAGGTPEEENPPKEKEDWEIPDASGWQKPIPCPEGMCTQEKIPPEMQPPDGAMFKKLSERDQEMVRKCEGHCVILVDMNGNTIGVEMPGKVGSHGGMSMMVDKSFWDARTEIGEANDAKLPPPALAAKQAAELAKKRATEQARNEETEQIRDGMTNNLIKQETGIDPSKPEPEPGTDGPQTVDGMSVADIKKELDKRKVLAQQRREEEERRRETDGGTGSGVEVTKTPPSRGEFEVGEGSEAEPDTGAMARSLKDFNPTILRKPTGPSVAATRRNVENMMQNPETVVGRLTTTERTIKPLKALPSGEVDEVMTGATELGEHLINTALEGAQPQESRNTVLCSAQMGAVNKKLDSCEDRH